LAARLTGWDIDILTPDEYNQSVERLANCAKSVAGADDVMVDKLIAIGVISVLDLADVGTEPLVNELKLTPDIAEKLVAAADKEAKALATEPKQKQTEKELSQQTNTIAEIAEKIVVAADKEANALVTEPEQKQAEKELAQQTNAANEQQS
jgi:N utilization substance protein A